MCSLLGLVIFTFVASVVPALAQNFPGAIFTTDVNYTVNQNVFVNKSDVYIDGGPQNNNSPGLPVGDYYFQVTDPSGKVLLSEDSVLCRTVVVSIPAGFTHGAITSTTNTAGPGGENCGHTLNTSPDPSNGSHGVQLMPYADTPDPGGVYKVWFTPVSKFDLVDPTRGSFGFANSDSKTDNFQVLSAQVLSAACGPQPCGGTPPQSTISGLKYNDLNVNGLHDPSGLPLGGWEIDVTGTKLGHPFSTAVFTASDGTWSVPNLDQGTQVTACAVLASQGPLSSATVSGIGVISTGARVTATYRLICWQGTIPMRATVQGLDFGTLR